MTASPTPPKRKRGRPTTLTPAKEKALNRMVAQGATYREACRKLKINRDAIYERRMADDAFSAASARATLLGTEANLELAEERLKRSTNKRISVDRELAHHYRWKASKLLSAYKDQLNVRADVGVTLKSEESDEELARTFVFAMHEAVHKAPLPKFTNATVDALKTVAEALFWRGGGSSDPRLTRGDPLYADLAEGIQEVARLVKSRLMPPPAPAALPAPAEDPAPRGPLDNVRKG